MVTETACDSCVLASDAVDITQHAHTTEGHVFQVTNGGRNDVERPGLYFPAYEDSSVYTVKPNWRRASA